MKIKVFKENGYWYVVVPWWTRHPWLAASSWSHGMQTANSIAAGIRGYEWEK